MDKIPSITDAKAQIDKMGMEAYLKSLYDTPELPKSDRDHNNSPLSLRQQLNKMIENKAGNKPVIDDYWSETITFLKSVGFRHFDAEEDTYVDPDCLADDIIMVESEHCRSKFCFVLKTDGQFQLWIQIDIACGFLEVPLRWNEIKYEWLNHIKLGIQGHPLKYS